MKNTMYLALMILATLPASAQTAESQNCSANAEASSALAQDYAARVDGLLRDAHASLHSISERMEAGLLTPKQAQEMKLAATRDVISRLDSITAVYDVRLDSTGINNKDGAAQRSVAGNPSAAHNPQGTVSVEALIGEAAAVARRGDEAIQ
jgi:hypothetical protein